MVRLTLGRPLVGRVRPAAGAHRQCRHPGRPRLGFGALVAVVDELVLVVVEVRISIVVAVLVVGIASGRIATSMSCSVVECVGPASPMSRASRRRARAPRVRRSTRKPVAPSSDSGTASRRRANIGTSTTSQAATSSTTINDVGIDDTAASLRHGSRTSLAHQPRSRACRICLGSPTPSR